MAFPYFAFLNLRMRRYCQQVVLLFLRNSGVLGRGIVDESQNETNAHATPCPCGEKKTGELVTYNGRTTSETNRYRAAVLVLAFQARGRQCRAIIF